MLPNANEMRKAMLEVLASFPEGINSKELDSQVAEKLQIAQEDLDLIRSGTRTEFAYRMAWERTHAKSRGEIERIRSKVWKLI